MTAASLAAALVAAGVLGAGAAHGAPSSSERLQGVEKRMREAREEATELEAKEKGVVAEIDELDRAVDGSEKRLEEIARQVEAAERARVEAERSIAELEAELAELRKRQRARVRGLDRLRRRGLGPVVLQAPGDLLDTVRYQRGIEAVLDADRRLAAQVRRNREESEAAHSRAAAAARELAARRDESEREVKELRGSRSAKRRLLASIREEGEKRAQLVEELERSAEKLRKLLEAEEAVRRAAAKEVKEAPPRGAFVAPVAGRPKVTTSRNGVEIAARSGTEIRAVAGGRVVYADWFSGYGKMVIVDHGGHLYSIYGYASELVASAGATVSAGETIARVGATGAAAEASLYFEMRLRGAPEDPGAYVPALARR